MPNLFFCGELIADLVETEPGSDRFQFRGGGCSGFGVIAATRVIETEGNEDVDRALYLGPISTDPFGQKLANWLQTSNVSLEFAHTTNRPSTLAVVDVRPGMENGFSFLQQGTTVGAIQPSELTYTTEPHEKNIFIYGSISTTLPSAGEILLEHAKQSRKDGLIYFDLNARPSVINEMDDYTGLVDRWAGIADVVKASDYDVSSAYGEISFREVAQRWIDAGAKLAIITSGNKGCWALTSSGVEVQIGAKKLNTPYTVGAGDSFNAGVALELVRSISAQDFRDIKWDPSLLERILLAGNRSASLHLISNGATLLAPSIDADTFERGVNTAVEPARKTIPISSRMSG